ncbi:unnamed protein product [Brachionus calyciflorus]|uniref:Uncharacterized protein n=1 Tax=Brachionus calyciflorus TaxID=104777 RepID=A0A814SMP5_9BILA|nr:unnamed protein product [Brachionus calyciflorus]
MLVETKKCASNRCHSNDNINSFGRCPFKYRIYFCKKTLNYFIDALSNQLHLDINSNVIDTIYGVHSLYKKEIMRLYKEQKRTPKIILNVLIANRNKGNYDIRIPLPKFEQVKI